MSITSAKTGATGISLALENNFMEPIASALVGAGGAVAIQFNDIPQTYKHLHIRGFAASPYTVTDYDDFSFQFNGDTGNNYAWHRLRGNNSNAATGGTASTFRGVANYLALESTYTGAFGVTVMDVLDYANPNKYTTTRAIGGAEFNSTGTSGVGITSSVWMDMTPVMSIKLYANQGNLRQYSRISLYGIKG